MASLPVGWGRGCSQVADLKGGAADSARMPGYVHIICTLVYMLLNIMIIIGIHYPIYKAIRGELRALFIFGCLVRRTGERAANGLQTAQVKSYQYLPLSILNTSTGTGLSFLPALVPCTYLARLRPWLPAVYLARLLPGSLPGWLPGCGPGYLPGCWLLSWYLPWYLPYLVAWLLPGILVPGILPGCCQVAAIRFLPAWFTALVPGYFLAACLARSARLKKG